MNNRITNFVIKNWYPIGYFPHVGLMYYNGQYYNDSTVKSSYVAESILYSTLWPVLLPFTILNYFTIPVKDSSPNLRENK